MEISLEDARQRAAILAGALAVAAILIFQASQMWLADRWIHSKDIREMERGAALLPGNGEAWDLLGHYYQWDFLHSDLPRALGDYQHAVRDDPRSADYWMDVASAKEAGGDVAGAEQAFERAQAVYPASGEVAFYYGNFLLRRQEIAAGYAQLRRAVAANPLLLPLAISRAWRSSEDANQLLDQVLPANVEAYTQALDFFASIHQGDAALAAWGRMRQLGKPIPLQQTFPLFDDLIREGRADDARRAWSEAVAASLPNEAAKNGSLIWDGDFQSDFANGGLGWSWDSPPGTSIDFDDQPGPNGSRAVRLDFTGGINVDLDAPFEYVPVEPSQHYRFHGEMRTDGITTESGMQFRVIDPSHVDVVNVSSDGLTGTQAWTPIHFDVTTGPDTHFVIVQLVRHPSRLFDNKLSGTVWIADVSLTPAGPAATTGAGAGTP